MAPRTVLTPTSVKGPFAAIVAGGADFTFAAADVSNGNEWLANGSDILVMWNSGLADAHTVTVASVADEKNRTADITAYELAAGEFATCQVGLTNSKGWQQTDKSIHINANHAEIKFAILRLPAGFGR